VTPRPRTRPENCGQCRLRRRHVHDRDGCHGINVAPHSISAGSRGSKLEQMALSRSAAFRDVAVQAAGTILDVTSGLSSTLLRREDGMVTLSTLPEDEIGTRLRVARAACRMTLTEQSEKDGYLVEHPLVTRVGSTESHRGAALSMSFWPSGLRRRRLRGRACQATRSFPGLC
jgi:hypothetical protein